MKTYYIQTQSRAGGFVDDLGTDDLAFANQYAFHLHAEGETVRIVKREEVIIPLQLVSLDLNPYDEEIPQ